MSAAADRSPGPQPRFCGADIDRAAGLRHDRARIASLLARADAQAVSADASGVLVEGGRLLRRPWSGDPAGAILLGLEDGRPLMAVDLGDGSEPRLGEHLVSLRDAGTTLLGPEAGLAAYMVGLLNWHRRHPHCSVCGSATDLAEAGLSRRCPDCSASHFPRTDPVVIMTVEWEGRLLLGSRRGWDPTRYSVLAGFVAPGETPEEAVLREVEEESGILARDPRYIVSQPWPFPASLMLGFHAESDGGRPTPGADEELSDVRWFTREEVIAMQQGTESRQLPGEVSIARQLIDLWVAG